MKNKKLIIFLIGLLFIIVPFFINSFSIFKMYSIFIGTILITINILKSKKDKYKTNLFLVIYIPIIIFIFTYALDYIKTYTFNLSPIYVIENKINDKISLYNSIFYRVYKCDQEYIFDNNYEKNFACDTKLINNIDINKLLTEPIESYKEYKHDFIKITGKISMISGNSKIEMRSYTNTEDNLNGRVKFNETSKLAIYLKDIDLTQYKIYDYITIVGYVDSFNKKENTIKITNSKIEDKKLYENYNVEVIEKNKCEQTLKEYTDGFYTKCLENIYIDYGVDKYDLAYALKDGKLTFKNILKEIKPLELEDKKVYELEKFNILSCSKDKNILLTKNELIDYSLCEE